MNILGNLNKDFKIISFEKGENIDLINNLKSKYGEWIPQDYLELISLKANMYININEKYLRIWKLSSNIGSILMNQAYQIQRYIPNSYAIGDDGEDHILIYLNRENENGLYMGEFGNLDEEAFEYLAPSLTDFLVYGIGIEVFENF